jgi:Sensors of blue-light using FAD
MSLVRLMYFSEYKLTKEAMRPRLDAVRRFARRNNRQGISGALVFDRDCCVAVLEGTRDEIWANFQKTLRGKRHSNVTLVEMAPIQDRQFDNLWIGAAESDDKSAPLFAPYRREGRLDPAAMTAGELRSLAGDLARSSKPVVKKPPQPGLLTALSLGFGKKYQPRPGRLWLDRRVLPAHV